jgi:transcriptional regulator with XRE-family HTH domain
MDGRPQPGSLDLVHKIARLVEERGWNQEDFARMAQLNRQTVRQILQPNASRRLRNLTISQCAKALGLSVNELRSLPLERLLPRMTGPKPDGDANLRHLYEIATQPELLAWIDRNPERASRLTADEREELLSLQGTGGPLTPIGVEHFVAVIERKRRLIDQVQAVAGTEYLDLLEKLVALLFEKIQPYADRK